MDKASLLQGKFSRATTADLEAADFVCIDPNVLIYNLKEYEIPSKPQKLYPIHPMMVSDEKMKQYIRNFVRLQMYRRALILKRDILCPSKAGSSKDNNNKK